MIYHELCRQFTYCEKKANHEKGIPWEDAYVKQMFLYPGVCNLVLKTGPDANMLTVTNEKFTSAASLKYTKSVDLVNLGESISF